MNLYYNFTGDKTTHCANAAKCDSAYGSLGDPLGWPFQTCTEMVMPLCGSGYPNDFFWKDCPFTVQKYGEFCAQTLVPFSHPDPLCLSSDSPPSPTTRHFSVPWPAVELSELLPSHQLLTLYSQMDIWIHGVVVATLMLIRSRDPLSVLS